MRVSSSPGFLGGLQSRLSSIKIVRRALSFFATSRPFSRHKGQVFDMRLHAICDGLSLPPCTHKGCYDRTTFPPPDYPFFLEKKQNQENQRGGGVEAGNQEI